MAGGLLRASTVMASGTMVSRVLGVVKAALLAAAIGSVGAEYADAFNNANLLPNTLYTLLMGGMLNAVLVPQIVKAMQNRDGGRGYINKLVTMCCTVLFIVTAIAMLAAPFLVWMTAVTWDADKLALATAFAYWCLPQIIFYGLYTVLGEVLNAKSVFGPFTWSPVVNNIVAIIGIVVFIVIFGADPQGQRDIHDLNQMAVAVLGGTATLGVVLQALILFVSWRRAGIRFTPDFAWRGMGLGQTVRIAGWSLATIVIMQIGGYFGSNVVALGSGVGPSNSAMNNVWLIFMMPHSVIAISLATAYFTRLSHFGQSGQLREFRNDFSASVRQVSLIMVLAAGAAFAGAPYVSRIINFGATQLQVEQFALVLKAYLISLAAYSFLSIVQRAFYALSDTRTPFLFTAVQMAIVIALSLLLFSAPPEYVGALFALVWSLATLVQTVLATLLLRRKIGSIDGTRILRSVARYVIAAVPAAAVGVLIAQLLSPWLGGSALPAILGLMLVGVVVAVVYLALLVLLRSPELNEIVGFIKQKIRRT